MTADPWMQLTAARMRDLHHEAEAHRLARGCRPPPVPRARIRRVYARLWWAARPRAAAWIPGLLEGRVPRRP